MFVVLATLALISLAYGAVETDKVESLPGFVGTLPSTHYSGCTIF
jgi:hypothetical protein